MTKFHVFFFFIACLTQVPRQAYEDDVKMSYSISPVSQSTKLLSKPGKAKRKIPKIPFKVRCGGEGGLHYK